MSSHFCFLCTSFNFDFCCGLLFALHHHFLKGHQIQPMPAVPERHNLLEPSYQSVKAYMPSFDSARLKEVLVVQTQVRALRNRETWTNTMDTANHAKIV